MKIGNVPIHRNELKLNKWYIGLEINKCPPTMFGVFRPHIFIIFVKFKQFAEPYDLLGNENEIKIGGWKSWSSPIGIELKIRRYK